MNAKNIKLTVGVPMFENAQILWLCLMGLTGQRPLAIFATPQREFNHSFEVIVNVCPGEDLTLKMLKDWAIVFEQHQIDFRIIENDERTPLVIKWITMAKAARGKYFMMVGSDCFTPTHAVANAIHAMDNGADWCHSHRIHFYNVNTGAIGLYEIPVNGKTGGECTALTEKMAEMKPSNLPRYIDRYVFDHCQPENVKAIHPIDGLHTDGFNRISIGRHTFYEKGKAPIPPFMFHQLDIFDLVPGRVGERLQELTKKFENASENGQGA